MPTIKTDTIMLYAGVALLAVIIMCMRSSSFTIENEPYRPPKNRHYETMKAHRQDKEKQLQNFIQSVDDYPHENKVVDVGDLWQKPWAPRPLWFQHAEPEEEVLL